MATPPSERLAKLEEKVQNLKDDFDEFKEDARQSFQLINNKLESHNDKLNELLKYKWFLGVLVVAAPQLWPMIKGLLFGGQ